MSKDVLFALLKDIADWGVKAVCFAGGGEPTLHPNFAEAVKYTYDLGMEVSIITNGTNFTDEIIDSMAKYMRWAGISVDCATRETFLKTKKVDLFDKVILNIEKLSKARNEQGSSIGTTYKFLIHPDNQNEIYDACVLAKRIGCDAIHIRPTSFLSYEDKEEPLDKELIDKQIKMAMELSDDNFEVIPFFVNFDEKLKRKIVFDKCEISPLLGVCLPSGWWTCIDNKGKDGLRLCDINKVREFWGSKEHLEILNKINPKKDCGKCTLAKYYPWFDDYRNDRFYWKFI
jgi:MoaA/NifB/PqqE/SkfB family radical SAM enzyme